MNSMHNSFSGPGTYSGSYPGYVPPPPSALPYYNGYPGDVNQSANPYYGKPGSAIPPGYSSAYPQASSMYYQQYGLGYQYAYGKYGISSSLGYSPEIPSSSAVHPPSVGGLQAPTTDLGLTGSMFSKNSKASSINTSSSNTTSTTQSPSPISTNAKGGTTPSPPIEANEGKKDIDKMKRCQVCGQVFRLMSECLAHMKAVHESPMNVYGLQHSSGSHMSQPPGMPPHSSNLGPPRSVGAPDSPLMALERMGWGEKQNIMSPLQSSSTSNPHHMLSVPHPHYQVSSVSQPHSSTQVYGSSPHLPLATHHQSSILHYHQPPQQHSSPGPQQSSNSIVNNNGSVVSEPSDVSRASSPKMEAQNNSPEDSQSLIKQRKSNSYSVSSIIGESEEKIQDTSKNNENVDNEEKQLNQDKQIEDADQTPDNKSEEKLLYEQTSVSVSDAINEKDKQSEINDQNQDAESEHRSPPQLSPHYNKDPKEEEEEFTNDVDEKECPPPSTLIVGKKDLLREIEASNKDEDYKQDDSNEITDSQQNSCIEVHKSQQSENEIPEVKTLESEESASEQHKNDEANQTSPPTNLHEQSTSIPQQTGLQHPSPVGTFQPNMKSQPGYPGWPMPMGPGYPGQYVYPGPQSGHPGQQPTNYSKPLGYPPSMRFPQYHQTGSPGGQYSPHEHQIRVPHNYMQGHPQGNWYPSRGDPKTMWSNWSNQSGHPYPQGYYGYTNASPNQKHPPPAHMHPPFSSNMPHAMVQSQKSQVIPNSASQSISALNGIHYGLPRHPNASSPLDHQKENIYNPSSAHLHYNEKTRSLKKSGYKIGPKSKTMTIKQYNQIDDLENYKCTISIQENGSLNGYISQESNCGLQSCDSSDSEMAMDDRPIFTQLKTAKRKYGTTRRDGIFIGPKRVKLAMQVKERQLKRRRSLREQIRQSELEEQLQAQRIEFAVEQTGPLGNVLLQSSILLSDKKVEGSESVEECIANIKAERQNPSQDNSQDIDVTKVIFSNSDSNLILSKKPGKKGQSKVFHNENSVRIKNDAILLQPPVRKLRAKDFKWSQFVKMMRYWCSDCGHGLKNQREVSNHTEDRCKKNCLYMLECYVMVPDIQTHPQYGSKVQELLEEYLVDGDHVCHTCYEIIAKKSDYLVHVDSHKDFMPWECTICGTRFKIRGSLKEHLRYTHMKGRVPCLKCNKVFPTSTLLRQHVKVHTQHYKYKSAKNREEELRAAMEATAGALEGPMSSTTSPEDNEKLSHEANEYRSWCKLMEMNAMKNISTFSGMGGSSAGGSLVDEDEDEGRDFDGCTSGDEGGSSVDNHPELARNCIMKSEISNS